jgi:hypothetical protein
MPNKDEKIINPVIITPGNIPSKADPGHDHDYDAETFLYIRRSVNDHGFSPLVGHTYLSPDIRIKDLSGNDIEYPETLVQYHLEVTVTNDGGIDAFKPYVEAFVITPSLGFHPDDAFWVGGNWIDIVPNHNSATTQFPWKPTAEDASPDSAWGAGHRCLAARVCGTNPPDSYIDMSIFDVRNDRHVAQRNIWVIEGGKNLLHSFRYVIHNPLVGRAAQFIIKAVEVKTEKEIEVIQDLVGIKNIKLSKLPLDGIGLVLEEQLPPRGMSDAKVKKAAPLPTGVLQKALPMNKIMSTEVSMQSAERRYGTVTVARNRGNSNGEINIVKVEQFDTKGNMVGGLCLVVKS